MHLDHYVFRLNSKTDKLINYEFTSMGAKGFIQKTVQFSRIDYNFYNLAFGDMDNQTGRFYDNVASGNNDHEKILATVAAVVESFTVEHPTSFIYAKGSTPSRTRL